MLCVYDWLSVCTDLEFMVFIKIWKKYIDKQIEFIGFIGNVIVFHEEF